MNPLTRMSFLGVLCVLAVPLRAEQAAQDSFPQALLEGRACFLTTAAQQQDLYRLGADGRCRSLKGEEGLNAIDAAALRSGRLKEAECADLRRASLGMGHLFKANLKGADLSQADLNKANIEDSDLAFAKLDGADLRGASFGNTDLKNTSLQGARCDARTLILMKSLSREEALAKGIVLVGPSPTEPGEGGGGGGSDWSLAGAAGSIRSLEMILVNARAQMSDVRLAAGQVGRAPNRFEREKAERRLESEASSLAGQVGSFISAVGNAAGQLGRLVDGITPNPRDRELLRQAQEIHSAAERVDQSARGMSKQLRGLGQEIYGASRSAGRLLEGSSENLEDAGEELERVAGRLWGRVIGAP